MKATMILKQGVSLWLVVAMLLAIVGGCAAPAEVPLAKEEGEIQRVVEVKAEGLTVHYLRQSSWGEEKFSSYFANQAQFKSDFKENFEQRLAQWDVSHASSRNHKSL